MVNSKNNDPLISMPLCWQKKGIYTQYDILTDAAYNNTMQDMKKK